MSIKRSNYCARVFCYRVLSLFSSTSAPSLVQFSFHFNVWLNLLHALKIAWRRYCVPTLNYSANGMWNWEIIAKKRMVKKYRGKKSEQKFAILNVNKMGNNKLQIKYPLLRSLEMFEIRIENAFHVSWFTIFGQPISSIL